MTRKEIDQLDRELRAYLESMVEDFGRPERRRAMALYVTGLLLDGDRKSLQPIAARLVDAEHEVEAMRQRLQQAVTVANWSEAEMFGRLARKLDRELPGIEALVIDDTGFAKKGRHSVGVARQYSGTLGRVDNCQVATSVHLAGEGTSGCVGLRLFLPEAWTNDRKRMRSVGVPPRTSFKRKWESAVALLDDALAAGVRRHVVLADAGYGDSAEFREALSLRSLQYVVGIQGAHCVWPPGAVPKRPLRKGAARFSAEGVEPWQIGALVEQIPVEEWTRVTWREGSRGSQASRFSAVRIHPAEGHHKGRPPGDEHWLLAEWRPGEAAPTKFWLSNLPADTSIKTLVRFAKLRWRVERDYQELKQEIGLDHFEGRTWRGFHHHAALCAVAHGFLALRRALFPPEENDVDPPNGASQLADGPAALARHLSSLPPAGQPRFAASRTFANVIT